MLEYSVLYPVNTVSRQVLSLDGMWRFKIDWDSAGREEKWQEGLSGFDMIPVPASFQDFYTDKEIREFVGDVWYETDVMVSSVYKEKGIFLRFGCATHFAQVYVNGQPAGSHEGGFLPFSMDISRLVEFDKKNRISVVVNNELSTANLPCGATITLKNGRKKAAPYFDFYNYSGLHRSVNLVICPKEYIFDYSTSYELEGADGKVHYQVETVGEGQVEVELLDESGASVARGQGRKGTLVVNNARLWQPRNPYLYTVRIHLCRDGALIDEYEDQDRKSVV